MRFQMIWLSPSDRRLVWCKTEAEASSNSEVARRAVRFLAGVVKNYGPIEVPPDDAVSQGSTAPTNVSFGERTSVDLLKLETLLGCARTQVVRRALIVFEQALLARKAKRDLVLPRPEGDTVAIGYTSLLVL